MKRNPFIISGLALAAFALVLSGCKKYVHQNIQAASNSSVALSNFNDVFEQLNAAVDSSLDAKTESTWMMNGTLCTEVTLSSLGAAFPKTLTIDYGTGCIGADGVSRTGKIIAVFDGNFEDENSTVIVSFDAFTNGQYSLMGTDSITNVGADGDGNPVFTEVLRDVVVSWNTQQILWQADLNRTWLEGDTTSFTTDTVGGMLGQAGLDDDVFSILGSASGNDSNTHPFTLEITQSLLLPTACEWITGGMLDISPANFNTGAVNYGNGDCDQQATMEVEGEVFNFTQ
jgi:hypothetical protein